MPTVDDCIQLLTERGDSEYGGEAVTQLEHALQCATLAEREGASAALISAALLHDVGHLLHVLPNDAPDQGIDDAHEDLGCRYLRKVFGEPISEPVRLHVPAKRYMCATIEGYQNQLSHPSLISLELQGGAMTPEEVKEFEQNGFANDAVRLRRWDDTAKVPKLATPSLHYFAKYLREAATVLD